MKNYITLWVFLTIFATSITSCETSDLNTDNQKENLFLEKISQWNLTNIKGGLLGLNENYETGAVKWTFSSKNSTLSIENNNQKDANLDIIKSGNYHYYIVNNKDMLYLYIEGLEFGHIIREQNTLKIDQGNTTNGPLTDGYILSFKK